MKHLRTRLERLEEWRPPRTGRWVVTHQHQPCLHAEPGPEYIRTEAGNEVPVTPSMRRRWEEDGAFHIVTCYVGTCHAAGCQARAAAHPRPECAR
jgi:hypothetical protein